MTLDALFPSTFALFDCLYKCERNFCGWKITLLKIFNFEILPELPYNEKINDWLVEVINLFGSGMNTSSFNPVISAKVR